MGVVQIYLHTCTVVPVRYMIYRSITILVNIRYRYVMVSIYFDISSIECDVRYLTIYRSSVGIVRFDTYKKCRYRNIADSSMHNTEC